MLGVQTLTRSTNTSYETKASMVDSSIHARLVKLACPLVNQMRFKFVDVSYSGSVDFFLQYTPDAIVERETPPCDIRNMSGSRFLARRLSRGYTSFTLTPGSIQYFCV